MQYSVNMLSKRATDTIFTLFTGFLVITAIVLGWQIWQTTRTSKTPLTTVTTPAPSASPIVTASSSPTSADDEKQLLNTPSQTSSQADKNTYAQLVSKYVKAVDNFDIKNCSPQPLAAQVKDGMIFTAKNSDSSPHTLLLDSAHRYQIPAKGQLKITANFGHGPGIYGYGCDQSTGAVGIFLVTPS